MSYFNASYYLSRYADVRAAVGAGVFTSALQHYEMYGAKEFRDPNVNFNTAYYLSTNADVRSALAVGTYATPLAHFDQYGVMENRAPSSAFAGFESARYMAENADVRAAVAVGTFKSALDHYLQYGEMEHRAVYTSVTPFFNETYYLAQNADVRAAVAQGTFVSGLQHYQMYGGREMRNPSADFDAAYYFATNADVRAGFAAGAFNTPLDHFAQFGVIENRPPSASFAGFDAARYLTENADVRAGIASGNFSSALDHYLQFGVIESRPIYSTGGLVIVSPGYVSTATLASLAPSVDEGGNASFTLQTSGVAAGTQYAYTISGISAADVQGGALSGIATIDADGRAVITVALLADVTTEGAEALTLSVAGKTASVVVNDTSTQFGQTFTLAAGATSVNEGGTVNFTLHTTNVAVGTQYTYVISGVSVSDVNGLTGTVTIDAAGNAVIPVVVVADATTEGAETLTVTVAGLTASTTINDTSIPLVATFALTAGATSVNEGGTVNFTLQTTNIAAGTLFTYVISGVAAADIVGNSLTGTVTINSSGVAVIPVVLISDATTEGAEALIVTVAGQTASTTINDTSLTGSTTGQPFVLTIAADTFVGGAGNDTFNGTYFDGGGTFGSTDVLTGGGGTDTLSIAINAVATTPPDTQWLGVSGIENVTMTTSGAGAQTIVTGANFQNAFQAAGIDLTVQTNAGAITIDMGGTSSGTTFTGAAAIHATSTGSGAHTITTGSGASTVQATTAAGAQTVIGANLTSVTITSTLGDQTITSTGSGNVTVVATAVDGAQTIATAGGNDTVTSSAKAGKLVTISTGAGNDVIVAGLSTDLITGGLGADTMTGGGAADTFAFAANGSIIGTSMDIITDFNTATGDILTFGGGTTLLAADATATVAGANVQTSAGGMVTFAGGDNTLALKTAAVQADIELDASGAIAMFVDGGNTYVYYAGLAAGNVDDQLIQLTGIASLTTITGGATTTIV